MLSECFCVVDSREKNTKRIESVKEFMESHGGAVEFGALPLCDYKIEGIFREKEICIGIEAKSLTDFSGSYQDLPDKLARSFELYNDVALFVEIPQIRTTSSDGFHATIVNQSVPDGSADVLQYAVLQNSLESWQREGVHVRQLQSETLWGYAIASVLISITKDTHRGLEITKLKDYRSQYLNILSKFDGVGLKTAQKIIKAYPNLYWLCSSSEEDIQDCIGKVTGKKLSDFIRNNELITAEWTRFGSKEQSQDFQQNASEIKPKQEISPQNIQTTKKDKKSLKSNPEQSSEVKNSELAYLDENKPVFKEVSRKVIKGGKIDFSALMEQDQVEVIKWSPKVLDTIKQNSKGIELNKLHEIFQQEDMPTYILNNIIDKLMQDGDCYEPKIGLLVATNPLQSSSAEHIQGSDPQESKLLLEGKNSSLSNVENSKLSTPDAPASQTLAGAGSNLPEAPYNSEFTVNPRLKDIVEFIRRHPRTLDDVGKEFGLSPEYCLKALYALKDEHKKIWFEKATCTWQFGIDKNPAPVVADKEYEVM